MNRYFLIIFILAFSLIACSDNHLEINNSYGFSVSHLPVVSKLKKGETAEIRCQIVCEGKYINTSYYLYYFQPNGNGELKLEDGTILTQNDTYALNKETFRLYYTSKSQVQQVIDIVFFDSAGNEFPLSFTFNHDSNS